MKRILMALAALPCISQAQILIWDQGPSHGTYGGSYSNLTHQTNYADIATFTSPVQVTRYRFYTSRDTANYTSMDVKVLADNAGIPGALIYTQEVPVGDTAFEGTFNGNQIWRADLNIAPLDLAAGTYWFGASGNNFEAGQTTMNPGPGDNQIAVFNGSVYSHFSVGDQDFQLYSGTVPEPASLIALGGLLAIAIRKRRR